jgi:hypothetical protein
MKSLTDGLPPEIARQIHPDWRKNESAYWAVRDQLLSQYQGQWIGFADGKVIATGKRPVVVLEESRTVAAHPFVTCVGREAEPVRVRTSRFAYDTSYATEPLPVIEAEFRTTSGDPGVFLDQVILDTGADTSILPWSDCQQMQLNPNQGFPGVMSGVAGGTANTLGFLVWVHLDGSE